MAGIEDGRLVIVVQLHLLHDRPVTSRDRKEDLVHHEAGGSTRDASLLYRFLFASQKKKNLTR